MIEWRVREGERVADDQPLVEVMTDKANVEIPSPVAGVVHKLCFAQGAIVPVGAVLIEIDDGAAAVAEPPASPAPQREPAPRETRAAAARRRPGRARERAASARASGPPRRTSPAPVPEARTARARCPRCASSRSAWAWTWQTWQAAGPAAASCAATWRRQLPTQQRRRPRPSSHLSPVPPAKDPQDWQRVPLRGLRRAIARHMREARQKAAHFTYVEELDVTALLERSESAPVGRLSPLAFIARAVVRTLPQHPALNASLDEQRDELVFKKRIHLGIAVAAEDGLLVPVIRDAGSLDTRALALATEALARRAREGKLTPDELRGGTFTISSLGKLGGIVSTPIVNYPEVAILGVNAIRREPRYVGDALVPRRLMNLSISVDHRVADGHQAAQFVAELKALLEAADFPDVFS